MLLRSRGEGIENEILMYFRSRKKSGQEISLSESIETGNDGAELSLMDVLGEDCDLLEQVDTRENGRLVRRAVSSALDDRERQVITMRYGLYGREPKRQREVAEALGLSRSYVSRIEKRALEKLRSALEE